MARRLAAGQLLERGRQPRVDARECAPVGLVLPVQAGVGRAIDQRLHLDRHVDQRGRQRQLAAQEVNFCQVVAQCHFGLAAQCVFQRQRAHVRVAVAVAADPLAHAQERGNGRRSAIFRCSAQRLFQLGIDARDLAQESGLVVAQRILDFVQHRECGKAQQSGLPELRDARAHLAFVVGKFERGQRVFGATVDLLALPDFVARGQQYGDGAFGIEDALALHLGGVRRQHRGDVAGSQCLDHLLDTDARLADARQRHFQAAFQAGAGTLGLGAAANLMPVFGQVGQVTEVREGANHAHGFDRAQALEQVFQRAVGTVIGIAAEGHRQRPDLFHQRIGGHPFLLENDLAEQAPQQPDVVDQRLIFVFFLVFARWVGDQARSAFHAGFSSVLLGPQQLAASQHASIPRRRKQYRAPLLNTAGSACDAWPDSRHGAAPDSAVRVTNPDAGEAGTFSERASIK